MAKAYQVLVLIPVWFVAALRQPLNKTAKSSAFIVARRAPDDDHLLHEAVDHAKHDEHPKDVLEKDFISLDRNGDKKLDVDELMFRQYATGCEASVAQARGLDYMQCGDKDKNGFISLEEFKASADPAGRFPGCVKDLKDRRVHGFVRFFEADTDWDNKLSEHELRVGIIKMWGPAGNYLARPLLLCVDKNKNSVVDQSEFHDMIAAYNPAAREWQMWEGTSDPAIIQCLKPAFKQFDIALVFTATDKNKDEKIGIQEYFDTMQAAGAPEIDYHTAEAVFKAADLDKDGYLSLEEFEKAGDSYKGAGESFALQGRGKATNATSMGVTSEVGMGAHCLAQNGDEWRAYANIGSSPPATNATLPKRNGKKQ